MSRLLLLLIFAFVRAEHFNKTCDGFQASFDINEVVGTWHVVAIIPEKLFPDRDINCYKVEFSETDEGGLRWLMNKTKRAAKEKPNNSMESIISRSKRTTRDVKHDKVNHDTTMNHDNKLNHDVKMNHESKVNHDIIVRLRFHTEKAFDVWSKSVEGVNGCFMQVLSLDVGVNDTQKAKSHDAMMQLHTVHTEDGTYLVQMLWGRLISAVIYRKKLGVTQDQLKPVFQFVEKRRGPQRLPKICDNPMRDLLFFH